MWVDIETGGRTEEDVKNCSTDSSKPCATGPRCQEPLVPCVEVTQSGAGEKPGKMAAIWTIHEWFLLLSKC